MPQSPHYYHEKKKCENEKHENSSHVRHYTSHEHEDDDMM